MVLNYSVQALPESERPRERLLKYGLEAMSVAELIAIILGSGTKSCSVLQLAQEIVTHFGTLKKLSQASIAELCQIHGLGKAKATQLKAALGLGLKLASSKETLKPKVQTPLDAYLILKNTIGLESREYFVALLLDVKSCLIQMINVSIGTLSTSLVHPREVFHTAIKHHAASLLIAHNHPSGDPTPSKEDIQTTKALVEAGRLLGIPVRDHLIIAEKGYFSFREKSAINFEIT